MSIVAVGMSGGVDSSVAAALLKSQGYDVIGLTMKIWGGKYQGSDAKCHSCYSPDEDEEIEDAQKVAVSLGIEHSTIELVNEYENIVLDYFIEEYKSGRTPNPCIKCNAQIKFNLLIDKARAQGIKFDKFATGHYVRLEYNEKNGRFILKQARDLRKDQSYFLSFLSQEQLGRSLFPLGNYRKDEVKKLAISMGLGMETKRESQNFIDGDYAQLIESHSPGPILDKYDKVIGQHEGIPFYTVGQRKKLGIYGKQPVYVIEIDPKRNAIIVGDKDDLLSDTLIAENLNWIAFPKLEKSINAEAKIRYASIKADVVITPLESNSVQVLFKQKQSAITPGQAIVFYDGDVVLGGGIIKKEHIEN